MARITTQEYNGKTQLSVKISDLRPADVPQEQVLLGRERYARWLREEFQQPAILDEMLPTREEIALVYKFLRRKGGCPYGADGLYLRLMRADIDYCRMLLALDILEEMGFVHRQEQSGADAYTVIPEAPRADLADSAILKKLTTLKTETLVS